MHDIETVVANEVSRMDFNAYKQVVFEGAQGLMLDQNYTKGFPHVTHANTGLANVLEIMELIPPAEIDVYYITRAYFTRHGNGPFPTETKDKPYPRIVDTTNITNKYQGILRFGLLQP